VDYSPLTKRKNACQAKGTPGGVTGYACLPSRGALSLACIFAGLLEHQSLPAVNGVPLALVKNPPLTES